MHADVQTSLLISVGLVVVVCFVFLRRVSTTFIACVTVPLALAGTLAVPNVRTLAPGPGAHVAGSPSGALPPFEQREGEVNQVMVTLKKAESNAALQTYKTRNEPKRRKA
jgi:hypothetical protein